MIDTVDIDRTSVVEPTPPAGLVPATLADVDRLTELQEAGEIRRTGECSQTAEDIRTDLNRTAAKHWLLPASDGRALAWLLVLDAPGHSNAVTWAELDPQLDAKTRHALLDFGLAYTRWARPSDRPHFGIEQSETDACQWAEGAGGEVIRRFATMQLPLIGDERPPPIPPGVQLRNVEDTEADWRILYDVIETAFREHYGHRDQSYEEYVEEDRPWVDDYSLCWLASVDGQPAAALLGKDRPTDGYVGVLGTLREFRGRGLGRLLLHTSFAEFAKRGHRRAELDVDLTNVTGALGLYESVGMTRARESLAYEFPSAAELSERSRG